MSDPFERATVAMFRHGVAATYTPMAGAPVPVTVIPSRGVISTGEYYERTEVVTKVAIQVSEVDEPKQGAELVISKGRFAGTYTIDRLELSDGYQHKVIVS